MVIAARVFRLHDLVIEVLVHLSLLIIFLLIRWRSLWLHRHLWFTVKTELLLWFSISIFVIVMRTYILGHKIIPLNILIVLVALTDVINFIARIITKVVRLISVNQLIIFFSRHTYRNWHLILFGYL